MILVANLNESGTMLWRVVLLVSGLVALWSFAASQWVDRHLSNLVSKTLKRYTNLGVQDFAKSQKIEREEKEGNNKQ